jgi:hypothetical protein
VECRSSKAVASRVESSKEQEHAILRQAVRGPFTRREIARV